MTIGRLRFLPLSFLLYATLVGGGSGCSSESASSPASVVTPAADAGICDPACTADEKCVDGACIGPTARQTSRIEAITKMSSTLHDMVGTIQDYPLDPARRLAEARQLLLARDEDGAYVAAAAHVVGEYRDGHVGFWVEDVCATPAAPALGTTMVGACALPYKDHAVIHRADAGNPLGLVVGDRIIAVDGRSSGTMMAGALADTPCGGPGASPSSRRFAAAASIFAAARIGRAYGIVHANGASETKTLDRLSRLQECGSSVPFSKDPPVAQAWLRADGIGVIRAASFYVQGAPSLDNAAAVTAIYKEEFAKVKTAPAIIWDARSNAGGVNPPAFSIVAGMPGARAQAIMNCGERTKGSHPPRFTSPFINEVEDRTSDATFAYDGKVVVLIDGATVSAGDQFALAVKRVAQGRVVLMGAPTYGAFGAATSQFKFGEDPPLLVYANDARCTNMDGTPLEARGVEPDEALEYEPADLARGVDTWLERAAAKLR